MCVIVVFIPRELPHAPTRLNPKSLPAHGRNPGIIGSRTTLGIILSLIQQRRFDGDDVLHKVLHALTGGRNNRVVK
jgi:hypothetical protein